MLLSRSLLSVFDKWWTTSKNDPIDNILTTHTSPSISTGSLIIKEYIGFNSFPPTKNKPIAVYPISKRENRTSPYKKFIFMIPQVSHTKKFLLFPPAALPSALISISRCCILASDPASHLYPYPQKACISLLPNARSFFLNDSGNNSSNLRSISKRSIFLYKFVQHPGSLVRHHAVSGSVYNGDISKPNNLTTLTMRLRSITPILPQPRNCLLFGFGSFFGSKCLVIFHPMPSIFRFVLLGPLRLLHATFSYSQM